MKIDNFVPNESADVKCFGKTSLTKSQRVWEPSEKKQR